MNLWIDGNGTLVWDNQQYTDAEGNLYTVTSDKSQIPGLTQVTQVAEPTDPTLIFSGFTVQTVNGVPTQVWTTTPKTLSSVQHQQLAELQTSLTNAVAAGFSSSALGTANNYASDPTSVAYMNASITMSLLPNASPSAVYPFFCGVGSAIPQLTNHTAAQIQQVGMDAYNFVLGLEQHYASKVAAVIAATADADVVAVTW